MSSEPHIHQLNWVSLVELRAQVSAFATAIDQLLVLNQQEASKAVLQEPGDFEPIGTSGKPLSMAAEVRRMVRLAGKDGITSSELAHLISKRRHSNIETVQTSLMRMQRAGGAQRVGRRWYSCDNEPEAACSSPYGPHPARLASCPLLVEDR